MRICWKDLVEDCERAGKAVRGLGILTSRPGIPFIHGVYWVNLGIDREYAVILHMSRFFRLRRIPQELLWSIFRLFFGPAVAAPWPRRTGKSTAVYFPSETPWAIGGPRG